MFQIFSVSLYVGRISFYGVTYITMAWKKINIQRENGEWVDAQAPEIISASRSTDIPAFYADWFFHRLDILHGATLSMEQIAMFLIKTHALSYFGPRTRNLCCNI